MSQLRQITAAIGLLLSASVSAVAAENAAAGSSQLLEALLPVEVLPSDPATANGQVRGFGMRLGAITVATQPARVLRAVLAGEPGAELGKSTVLDFTLLGPIKTDADGRLTVDADASHIAWCEDDARQRATIRCFQDLDADGKLDTVRSGILPRLDTLSINRVGAPRPVTPFAYRALGTEELPRLLLSYISCPADPPDYKYALEIQRVQANGRKGSSMSGSCDAIATAVEGDANLYQFGRFKVSLSGDGGTKTATLVEGISPGTLLGHVRGDRPLTDAAATKSFRQDQLDASGGLPFLYFAAKPQITSPAASNTEILVGEVAHGITGRLTSPLIGLGYLGRKEELPAGTALYGALMSNSRADPNLDPQIIWCVPDQGAKAWGSRCAANGPVGVKLVPNYERFTLEALSVGSGGKAVTQPIVERQALDFGEPIHLVIKFVKWDRRRAILSTKTGFKNDDAPFRELRLQRAADGSAYLLVGERLLKLSPSPANPAAVSIEYDGEIEAGSDAQPIDAFTLQQRWRGGKE